jgi:hypothetical protein
MKSSLNPKHIEGIYNYCDRWCERCAFTTKCLVFARTGNTDIEQNDINNKAFWDKLSQTFSETISLLQQEAEKHGIDLKPLQDEEWEAYKKARKAGKAEMAKHPLIVISKAYGMKATALFKRTELYKQKGEEMTQQVEMGIKSIRDAKAEVFDMDDCLEIVQWYVFMIQVKFMRALPMKPGEEKNKYFMRDSNGSAKVALIAVDRCLLAWQKLLQYLPDAEDEIISLLALLQKIRNIGEKAFPKARKFKRKGLDDQAL